MAPATQRIIITAGVVLVLLIPQRARGQLTWMKDSRTIHYVEDDQPTALGIRSGYTSSHYESYAYGPGDFSRWYHTNKPSGIVRQVESPSTTRIVV